MTKEEYQKLVSEMTWSFSRLNGFHHCKFCWAKNYIEKDKENSEQNEFARVGVYIHELLEDFYKGELLEFQLTPMFRKWFKSESRDYPNNKYVDLENMYFDGFSKGLENIDKFEEYDIVEVEPKISVKIKGYEFIGFMDLLVRHKKSGEYMIVDHKSWSKKKSKKDMVKYTRQLYLYSIYVKEKFGQYPSRLVFHLARKNKLVGSFFEEDMLEEAKQWVVDTIDEILECEEFPVTEDKFFGWNLCNYRNHENHIVKDDNKDVESFILRLEDIDYRE